MLVAGWVGLGLACAHVPQKYIAREGGDLSLPNDPNALLAIADEMSRLGPGGPDLTRSLAAADRVLAADPRHGEAAWRAARALYLQTYMKNVDRAHLAAKCMDAAAVATAYSKRAEAHYYSALCMGARAKARQIEGLDLVPRMEKAGQAALAGDPTIAKAGPHRLLGGIYLWAPAWPASVGDLDLALDHLREAVELAPDWAENHILLAYALLEDEQVDEAADAVAVAKEKLKLPQSDGWRSEWTAQIVELEQKIEEER